MVIKARFNPHVSLPNLSDYGLLVHRHDPCVPHLLATVRGRLYQSRKGPA